MKCQCMNTHQGESNRIFNEQAAKRKQACEEKHDCHNCAYRLNKQINRRGGFYRSLWCFTCQDFDHWTPPESEARIAVKGDKEVKTDTGIELIATERKRQIEAEGWDKYHDDEHEDGALASAGACYAADVANPTDWTDPNEDAYPKHWPWAHCWWKPTPKDPVRQLVKAGALIAAEIDRLNRNEQAGIGAKEECTGNYATCPCKTCEAMRGGKPLPVGTDLYGARISSRARQGGGGIVKLILPDRTETDMTELIQIREQAIKALNKAHRSKIRAVLRMNEAMDILKGCRGRIRLLAMMERAEQGKEGS